MTSPAPLMWWRPSVLLLRPRVGSDSPERLFSGRLDDAVRCALGRAEDERPRLRLKCVGRAEVLYWVEIAALAAHDDFPVLI